MISKVISLPNIKLIKLHSFHLYNIQSDADIWFLVDKMLTNQSQIDCFEERIITQCLPRCLCSFLSNISRVFKIVLLQSPSPIQ